MLLPMTLILMPVKRFFVTILLLFFFVTKLYDKKLLAYVNGAVFMPVATGLYGTSNMT